MVVIIIKCADCGCYPRACKKNECPDCTLEFCCYYAIIADHQLFITEGNT